ncbi:hypothetical protein V3C99_006021 [Haemonchus contortus]|nr:Glycosyl transferase domain containing protein [Haemonchus contortus]
MRARQGIRWALFASLLFFILGMGLLMTLSIVPTDSYFLQRNRHAKIIEKIRNFPQGGEDVKLDQPWAISNPEVISDISFFDRSEENYLVSNFSYSKGLGNLMFQYASLRSLAIKRHSTLVVPITNVLRRAFELNATFVTEKVANKLLRRAAKATIETKSCCKFVSIPNSANEKITAITGYLQNPRYFVPENEELVRKEFEFLPAVQEQALGFLRALAARRALERARPLYFDGKPSDSAFEMEADAMFDDLYYIGVHVRRGMDISMNTRNLRHGHQAATPDYYRKAMEMASKGKENAIFVICSDNPVWSKRNLPKYDKGMIFACPGVHREVDMAILLHCDALILSPGTFSWWAGFLNTKSEKTIYYDGWPRPGSDLMKMVNKTELYPSSWVPLL